MRWETPLGVTHLKACKAVEQPGDRAVHLRESGPGRRTVVFTTKAAAIDGGAGIQEWTVDVVLRDSMRAAAVEVNVQGPPSSRRLRHKSWR